ncbi:TPA: hypothetical protein LTU46_002666 [Enterococcus faecium]|nr:hypothetical protein [Enterococcus faecium]
MYNISVNKLINFQKERFFMGWYGDYSSANEVIEEKKGYAKNGLEIVDTKVTKTYGIILFKDAEGTYDIDSFIFRDEMYKPIYFLNDSPAYFKKIPKKWLKFFVGDQEKMVKQQLDRIKEENNKPNLDDLLVAGKTYSIWDGSYVAVYQYKLKRSFIFRLQDGSLTRFTRLSAGDVKEVT